MSLGHLAQFGVTVFVVAEMDAGVLNLLIGEAVENAFRNHGGTVVDTHYLTLDDAAHHHVDNLVDGNLCLVEEFGDDHHGIMAGTGDAEGKMSGRAAHGRDHKPVLRCAGVFHDSGADDRALGFGAVVAEGGRAVRQREVVVDGLGHMDVGDGIMLALQELGDTVCRRGGVVATHGDKQLHVVILEEGEVETLLKVFVGGFETAHLEDAATLVEDFVGREEIEFLHAGFIGEKGAVAAVQTDYTGVHSGGRTATCEDCYTFHVVFVVFDD